MRLTQYLFFFVVLFASCTKSNDDVTLNRPMVDVVIGAASVASTRTALDPDDGLTVKWCVKDEVAVWADGATPLNGDKFVLNYYGTNYSTAEFSSTIQQMATGSYTYTSFYPYGGIKSTNGKKVTYNIPSIQSGKYDGALDFRATNPVSGCSELSGSIVGNPELGFRSITHALKITVPAGYGSDEIAKIYVITSSKVDGDATIDISKANSVPTVPAGDVSATFKFADGSSVDGSDCSIMTLDLSGNTLKSGDGKSAWLFINPTDDVKAISFTSINKLGKVVGTHNINLGGLDFEAGYITPVNLGANLKHAIPSTMLTLKEGANNLGEGVNSLTITAPSGVNFADGSNSVAFTGLNSNAEFSVDLEVDVLSYNSFMDETLDIEYDSNSATVSGSVALISANLDTDGSYKCTVPYLFEEDFSGLSNYSNYDTYDMAGPSDDKHHAEMLTAAGLIGWSGDRVGVNATAGSIRVTCRLEGGSAGLAASNYRYTGRLDSKQISNIKSGKKVAVNVTYKYSGGQQINVGSKNSSTMYYRHTTTTTKGVITAKTYSRWWSFGKLVGGTGVFYENKLEIGGSYTTINRDGGYEIGECTSETRLSWLIDVDRWTEFAQNGHYWLYLDDIKVSIK